MAAQAQNFSRQIAHLYLTGTTPEQNAYPAQLAKKLQP